MIIRKDKAETSIDKLQSLVERIELYAKTENGFHNNQLHEIEKCNDLLNNILLQPRLPNAGEYVPNIKKNTDDWVAQAWIDGRSQHLEEGLKSKTDEQRHAIEERAIYLLKEQIPKYSWQHHQRELAARVLKRMEKRLENGTLLHLPSEVRDLLITFKTFKKGDKYKHRKYHEFAWGEKVYTSIGNNKRSYGFVSQETNHFVLIIDKYGNKFRKKKSNVQVATNRKRLFDRLIREVE